MNWTTITDMAIANLISGGVIVGVISIIGNHLSNKSLAKLQASLDEKSKRVEAEISKKNYISRTRFDTEFSIYRDLTSAFWQMVLDINSMIPFGYHKTTNDEKLRLKLDKEHYEKARESVFEAQNALHSNSAFIPKDFCSAYEELLELARWQLDAYEQRFLIDNHAEDKNCFSSDDNKRTGELLKKWDAHTDNIRLYLSNLDVIP